MNFKKFGENKLLGSSFADAEMHLIKVLQSNSISAPFNELRYELYPKKSIILHDLPTTSRSFKAHLKKCYSLINEILNLLSIKKSLEPTKSGWMKVVLCLIPIKREVTLPNGYIIECGCSK